MKYVDIENLKENMKTAETIYSVDDEIELLTMGTILNKRHISLLSNAKIKKVLVFDEGELDEEINREVSKDEILDTLAEHGEENPNSLYDTIEKTEKVNYEKIIQDIYSRNVEIKVLTGEANTPIDVKHEESIKNTRNIFYSLENSDDIPVDEMKNELNKMLPDILNNNDVLMRLRQLKETDDYLFEHSFRVCILASNVAKWLKYSEDDIKNIALSALLYEIGNMRIPKSILSKKGPLNEAEINLVRKHPQLAYHLLLNTKGINQDVRFVALQHHERIDGSGYPLKIKNNQIHDYSKVIMICDIYDALTHDRPYRNKISPFSAAEHILWQSGNTIDPKTSYFLLKNLSDYYTGKNCVLNSGEIAKIVYVDINHPTKPILQVDDKFIDLTKNTKYKILDFIE